MAISWVQGDSATNYMSGGTSATVSLTGVAAGNCLVLSATLHEFITLGKGAPIVTDNQGNPWQLAAQSPIATRSDGPQDWSVYVWVALGVAGGLTQVTFTSPTDDSPSIAITIDEYSGVDPTQAIDALITFASTQSDSAATAIVGGSLTVPTGELIYGVVFSGGQSDNVYTLDTGFVQRETASGGSGAGALSVASFDQLSSGSTYSNTISLASGTTPLTIQTVLITLSPTLLTQPYIQSAFYENCSVASTHLTQATYPFPNGAGNLLVLCAFVAGRLDPVVTDTQGNTWVIVYDGTQIASRNFIMAYALNCKGGANTVTLDTLFGGDDVTMSIIIAEYEGVSGFLSSSFGASDPNTSVDTGNIVVSAPDSLLVSYFLGGTIAITNPYAYGPADNLGTRRFQISSSGFLNQSAFSMALADQVESIAGTYNNVFTVDRSGPLEAAILGFKLSLALQCANSAAFLGVLYTSALVATGGKAPYTYSIIGGGLPPGLTLDGSTGIISGVPEAVGIYPYTAEVTDDLDNHATASCVISVVAPIVKTCGKLPTLEITRDMDANWGDHSTFFITQDEPLPFTLRGLVLRMSYNQD